MNMKHEPTIRKPGEGRTIGVVGDIYRFFATGDDTDGKYAMFEAIVPPGGGPPPHIHSREEEAFCGTSVRDRDQSASALTY